MLHLSVGVGGELVVKVLRILSSLHGMTEPADVCATQVQVRPCICQ